MRLMHLPVKREREAKKTNGFKNINWEFVGVWTAAAGIMLIVLLLIVSLITSLLLDGISFLRGTTLLLPELIMALLIVFAGAALAAMSDVHDRFKKGGEHGKG